MAASASTSPHSKAKSRTVKRRPWTLSIPLACVAATAGRSDTAEAAVPVVRSFIRKLPSEAPFADEWIDVTSHPAAERRKVGARHVAGPGTWVFVAYPRRSALALAGVRLVDW